MDTLLSVKQVAYILKVHPLSVRRYISQGKLHAVRAAGNVRIRESDLLKFQQNIETPAPLPASQDVLVRAKRQLARTFSQDDPLLRLGGRGASLS